MDYKMKELRDNQAYLCIDAGGTFLKSAVFDDSGNILPDSSYTIRIYSDKPKSELLLAFNDVIYHGIEIIRNNEKYLNGIGMCFPGPFDYGKGMSLMKHKYKDIYGFSLRDYFLGLPVIPSDIPVLFIHDVGAVLKGEISLGAAQGFTNVAVVTLGTGLGFSIFKNGEIQSNDIGGPLISVYNLPYRDGILEILCHAEVFCVCTKI
jgi:glucokinase